MNGQTLLKPILLDCQYILAWFNSLMKGISSAELASDVLIKLSQLPGKVFQYFKILPDGSSPEG